VGPLGTALADGIALGKNPVHGARAAEVLTSLEQDGVDVSRRTVVELLGTQDADDFVAILRRKPPRMRSIRRRLGLTRGGLIAARRIDLWVDKAMAVPRGTGDAERIACGRHAHRRCVLLDELHGE
jgi:hypothetical protein